MKTFSEATATRLDIAISIHLIPIGEPKIQVMINDDILFDDILRSPIHLNYQHGLLEPLDFSIQLCDKKYTLEYETAIIVDKVMIDGISMIPEMTHHFHYENDHGFSDPTSYIGFNGIWKLDTRECFYRWWHQVSGQGWLLYPTE